MNVDPGLFTREEVEPEPAFLEDCRTHPERLPPRLSGALSKAANVAVQRRRVSAGRCDRLLAGGRNVPAENGNELNRHDDVILAVGSTFSLL